MIVCPLQSFGLGDIIFSQSLIKNIIDKNDKICWSVYPDLVEGLNRAYPDVAFVPDNLLNIDFNQKIDTITNNIRIIPIRWADNILQLTLDDCMKSKYMLYNLDYKMWMQHANYVRDSKREESLYDKVVGGYKSYRLVNETFNTTLDGKRAIPLSTELPIVQLKKVEGYSLFDWSLVIERAAEVHTVSTSLFYLLELLNLHQPLHLYPRPNDPKFQHINYLFTKSYILH